MLIRLTSLHVHNGTSYPADSILDVTTEIRDWLSAAGKAINVTLRNEWTNVLVPAANDLVSLGNAWYYANPANVPPVNQSPGVHAGWILATYGVLPAVVSTNVVAELNVTTLRIRDDQGKFTQVKPVSVDDGQTLDLQTPVTIS